MGAINIEKLTELRNKVIRYLEEQVFCGKTSVENEEQTKNWLILPLLSALGYDTQSSDVVPEVTADYYKKGEKVDYMLQVNNLPVALIECKKFGEPLGKHINQLFRYFPTGNVHLGILTNGVVYQFFTDSQKENVMDKKPYFTFDISEDDLDLLNDYAKANITQASIPSIVNKRKQLEQQKEQEISDYKSRINELQAEINKQKEEPNMNEQIYNAMLVQQLLKADKLEKENKQLKEKAKPKKEKVFYGHTDLDKQKVPADIAQDMVALLPEDVFVPEAKFFDPFCRYGELLMAVKERLMQSQAMKKAFPDEDDRDDYIRDNQLYAFVIDEKGLKKVTKVIHNTPNPKEPHVVCFGSEDVYKKAMKSDNKIFIVEKLKELGQMRFDVVIGNPPYNRGMDIDFVKMSFDLSTKYTVMITPAKWQTAEADQKIASQMSYGEFRKQLVPHMSHVCFYPCCKDVFDIYQTDGITYYILDKKQTYEKARIINRCNDIESFNSEEYRSILNSESLLNVGQEIIDYLGDYAKYKFSYIKHNKRYEVWMNTKVSGYDWYATKNPRYVLSTSRLLDNSRGDTYDGEAKCIFESDDIEECKSFASWIYSRFTRFFLIPNISKLNNIQTDHCFRFVPAPPSGKFDHIYTDEELYKAFKLPQKYIDVIEAVIKERK